MPLDCSARNVLQAPSVEKWEYLPEVPTVQLVSPDEDETQFFSDYKKL